MQFSYQQHCYIRGEHPQHVRPQVDLARMATRRHILTGSAGVVAVWATPTIVGFGPIAAAQASGPGPEIPSLTPGAVLADPPPPDLSIGAVESNTDTLVFLEAGCVILTAPIIVNRSSPGSFNGNSNENTTVPAGTKICSYFVHGDRLNLPGRLAGGATFSTNPILGLIYETAQFNATSFLEVPGVNYAYGPAEGNDFMTLDLTPGSNTVTWDLRFGGATDQIRIITAC